MSDAPITVETIIQSASRDIKLHWDGSVTGMNANPYAFDADFFEVPFNARPGSDKPLIVYHKLRKPTVAELLDRESQITYEMVEISSREEEIRTDDEMANARLWDKVAVAVKGYKGFDDWHELTPEDRSAMRSGHKSIAIRMLYAGTCEIEGDEDSVSIGADTWTVRQEIGAKKDPDFVVRHILREPTEAERAKFKRSSSSTSYVKGAKYQQVRIRTNLRAYIELYDALIENVIGGTVGGRGLATDNGFRNQFIPAIDLIWKRQIIQCLMSTLEAQISD